MRQGVAALYLCASAVLNTAFNGTVAANEQVVRSEAKRFLSALLAKDQQELITFEPTEKMFSDGNKIDHEILEFIYQPSDKSSKSVTEIAGMDHIAFKIVPQPDASFIVLFYPRRYKKKIDTSIRFIDEQWMQKYFACAFRLSNSKLVLHENFCFAETGGPFH